LKHFIDYKDNIEIPGASTHILANYNFLFGFI